MGFRNPITTLSALDTGAASGRSSVYVDPVNNVIGLRGYLGADSDSLIRRDLLIPGGRLRVDSGSYAQGNGVPLAGPVLDFEVTGRTIPYTRTLRLGNADVVDLGGAKLVSGTTLGDSGWTDFGAPAAGMAKGGIGCWWRVLNGVFYAMIEVTLTGGAAGTWGTVTPYTLAAANRPAKFYVDEGMMYGGTQGVGTPVEVDINNSTGAITIIGRSLNAVGVNIAFSYPLGP
jgi:hypothetical protein